MSEPLDHREAGQRQAQADYWWNKKATEAQKADGRARTYELHNPTDADKKTIKREMEKDPHTR